MHALDHVFVCCSPGADEEAAALAALGLTEGTANTHPGQGTASRRFFFQNAYLELFWVTDEDEARGPVAGPTRLWERWSARGTGAACPFAVILRPSDPAKPEPPFATWAYRPPYLPAPLAIDLAKDTPLAEPAFFHIGFARPPEQYLTQPTVHPRGVQRLTAVEIGLLDTRALSPAARAIEKAGLVSFRTAGEYVMTLSFDGATGGASADLRPTMPVVLRWPA
jgi:hypothetical protein